MNDTLQPSGAGATPRRKRQPAALALAGHRWFPLWAIVRHRGRVSGAEYETPIAVVPTHDRQVILVCLPWGATSNWARNVVAAEGATLRWKGRDIAATQPRIVPADEAAALAKGPFTAVVRRMPAAIELRVS